jgi:A/G-specific adenine glycosylase
MKPDAQAIRDFRHVVLDYYEKTGRHDLPWRKTRDPYKILVSEVMLQQTQVSRVLVKYREFLAAYPTIEDLAGASLSDVLKVWSGLGYNRRGRFLQLAAQAVVERHKGKVPQDVMILESLPGIGAYTARAIATFAFNQPHAFIETNIRSVFLHHFFPKGRNVSDARLMPIIEAAIDRDDPRRWYWALMDYGVLLKQVYGNPSRRSKHHTRQAKFEGSMRQARGAILMYLHTHATATEKELCTATGIEIARIHAALFGLTKDKMLVREDGEWKVA